MHKITFSQLTQAQEIHSALEHTPKYITYT